MIHPVFPSITLSNAKMNIIPPTMKKAAIAHIKIRPINIPRYLRMARMAPIASNIKKNLPIDLSFSQRIITIIVNGIMYDILYKS